MPLSGIRHGIGTENGWIQHGTGQEYMIKSTVLASISPKVTPVTSELISFYLGGRELLSGTVH